MSLLEQFSQGKPGLLHTGLDLTKHDVFVGESESILHTVAPEIAEQVVPNLERFQLNWHPLGFLSIKLGAIEGIGTLRFHAWPAGLRVESPRGPKIHDHAWHLASLVHEGIYEDTLYDVREVEGTYNEEDRTTRGLLRVFRPTVTATSAALETDGTCASAQATEDRTVQTGTIHHIPINTFHVTTIPQSNLASTIVLESPAINGRTRILMDTPPDPLRDPKQIATDEHVALIQMQLLGAR